MTTVFILWTQGQAWAVNSMTSLPAPYLARHLITMRVAYLAPSSILTGEFNLNNFVIGVKQITVTLLIKFIYD